MTDAQPSLVQRLRADREAPTHDPNIVQVTPPSPLALEAADEIERLEEVLWEEPSKWSWDTLLWVGRRLLAEHYPVAIFTGASGDPGPDYVVALRSALERCEKR